MIRYEGSELHKANSECPRDRLKIRRHYVEIAIRTWRSAHNREQEAFFRAALKHLNERIGPLIPPKPPTTH